MGRRPLATAALAAGVVLILLALLADAVGIGGEEGFGWKQAIALAAGLALALVGAAMLAGLLKLGGEAAEPQRTERPRSEDPPPPPD